MAFLNVKNRAESTLASGINDSVTSLTVATGEGANFPATNFHITIDDEILLCSSRTTDTLTVERAEEDTTAASHSEDAAVELRVTAEIISELQTAANSIPVKATGAEINTGTDDAKFATPKAVTDSKLIASDETVTLTNKTITPRILTFTSDATPEVDSDDYDAVTITALAVAITDVNMSGTPTNFQKLIFRIRDDNDAGGYAITWGDDFEDAGVALPIITVADKILTVGFIYNTVTSKWGCVAVANET